MKEIYVTRSSMPPKEEYFNEISDLWDSCFLTNMGEKHQRLEKDMREYLQVDSLSLFSNGHMALELIIQAMGLTGEIITTPFTFASTTHAIVRNGLIPVFCDINPDDYTIDASKIEELITEKTSAILPVHVYGHVCDVETIHKIAKQHHLTVLYDAAHAFGERYKGRAVADYGDASMLSFHATKVFHTIEGGAICYHEKKLGEELYRLKNFGIRSEEIVDGIGANAKMNEFQAAMGLCNLRHIDEEIKKRKIVAECYCENLKDIKEIRIPQKKRNIMYNYAYFPVVISEDSRLSRNELYEALKKEGIYSRKYFYPITNTFDCYKGMIDNCSTPIALDISRRVLTLPLYADLKIEDVKEISKLIHKLFGYRIENKNY